MKEISREKRELLYLEAHHHCVYCGRYIPDISDMTVDHIMPRFLGGTDAFENIVCSCSACNERKADKYVMEYIFSLSGNQLRHYVTRIEQLYREGFLPYEKKVQLEGMIVLPKRRVINLFLPCGHHIHCDIVICRKLRPRDLKESLD